MKQKNVGKKAETDMLSALTKIVLVIIILIPLFFIMKKLVGIFIPEEVESTKRNFDQLVATLQNLPEYSNIASYPIFIDEKYAIVGYKSNSNAIGGMCTQYAIGSPYFNKKPEACGIGDQGCICLCKATNDFTKICQDNDEVVKCFGYNELKEDFSFQGCSSETAQCDFAILKGKKEIQTIWLERGELSYTISSVPCEQTTPS